MGQSDVLEWLENKRATGDEYYRSYAEIHQAMGRDGLSLSYPNVWLAVRNLYVKG